MLCLQIKFQAQPKRNSIFDRSFPAKRNEFVLEGLFFSRQLATKQSAFHSSRSYARSYEVVESEKLFVAMYAADDSSSGIADRVGIWIKVILWDSIYHMLCCFQSLNDAWVEWKLNFRDCFHHLSQLDRFSSCRSPLQVYLYLHTALNTLDPRPWALFKNSLKLITLTALLHIFPRVKISLRRKLSIYLSSPTCRT